MRKRKMEIETNSHLESAIAKIKHEIDAGKKVILNSIKTGKNEALLVYKIMSYPAPFL